MNKKISTLIAAVELLRKEIDPELQAQTMLTFLYIAQYGEITIKSLGQIMKSSTASASRNAAYWGLWHRKGQPGQRMVDHTEDTVDRRIKYVSLNAKGRRFLDKLAAAMGAV